MDLIRDYDVIIDGTDNFPTRYCVKRRLRAQGKPNVYGSIFASKAWSPSSRRT